MLTHNRTPNRFFAVIPCAGLGSRAGTAIPKQYQRIAGLPMVIHSLNAFTQVARLTQGVLVIAPDDAYMEEVLQAQPQPLFELTRTGGDTRAKSVLAGLHKLVELGAQDEDWVLVHDAARCLVTSAQINVLIDACQDDEVGGLLAHQLADTLKAQANGRVTHTLDRSDKWLAQTPQMFRLNRLLQALEHTGLAVTDESSAMEALGLHPKLVAGSAQNFKVTYPDDFALAQAILSMRY